MKIIGLTGNIATGKSTVASMFKEMGATVIDADKIAKDIVGKGKPALKKIV
ncbi:MAG: dephospho-CoA kinase, partial [Candidatus Dadabacteria bacterium]|nr:dephospho-CoA kinase [Candidatus Dadabacteria bacterium]NIT13620.1 dephospho-CoA kinase [Candidatus Dadabacteria bacterium]